MLNITQTELYLINIVLLTSMIFLAFLFFLKRRNRLEVEVLYPDKTFKTERWKKQVVSGEAKLVFGPRKTPENISYSPGDFFQEVKPWYKFFRLPKRKLYVNKAVKETIGFKTDTPKKEKLGKLQYHWTQAEVKEWVEKQIAREKAKAKPYDNKMFILLMVIIMANMFISFLIARKLDVF